MTVSPTKRAAVQAAPSPRGSQAGRRHPLEDALPGIVTGLSCVYLVAVIAVALARLDYPFELEWLEGAVLTSATRLMHGQPMYPPPSLSYIPLNYPPLFHMVSAAAMMLMGEGFHAMRAVSLAAAIAAMALTFGFVRRVTGRAWAGVLAVGLFAACYRSGGAWLDVGRLDALSLALLLAGVLTLDRDRSPLRGPALGAGLAVLSFLAKPTTAVMFVPVIAWCMLESRSRGFRLALFYAGFLAASILGLDAWSAGGFSYYTFAVASRRPFEWRLAGQFPIFDFLIPLAPALLVIAAAAARPATRRPLRPLGAFLALAVGHIGTTWVLRTHRGCFENVLIPVHLSVMGLAAVAYARLTAESRSSSAARLTALLAAVALLAQLCIMAWNPWKEIPTAQDRAEGERILGHLRNTQGRVLVSSHPYLAVLAGKPETAHVQCFMDVVKGAHGARERALLAEMRDSLAAHAWELVVLDTRDWLAEEAQLAGYRPKSFVFLDAGPFWPKTGMHTRPEYVWECGAPADSAWRRANGVKGVCRRGRHAP